MIFSRKIFLKQILNLKFTLIFLIPALTVHAEIDYSPRNNGGAMGLESGGKPIDAVIVNPALLGTQRVPRMSVSAAPFTSAGMGYKSNNLKIPRDIDYLKIGLLEKGNTFNRILREAMGVQKMNDSAAVGKIDSDYPSKTTFYSGFTFSLASLTIERFAFDIATQIHNDMSFSKAGLVSIGADSLENFQMDNYDAADFGINSVWSSRASLAFGFALSSIPLLDKYLHLPKTAAGLRLSYIMGHSFIKTENGTDTGSGTWQGNYKASGLGLSPTGFSNPLNGHGYDINAAVTFYSRRAGLSIILENLGAVYWQNDLAEGTYTLSPDDWQSGGLLPPKSSDTLDSETVFKTRRPTALSASYSYKWSAPDSLKKAVHYLAHYVYGAATYKYTFNEYPGISSGSVFSIGAATGLFNGIVPLRLGWSFGGRDRFTSSVGTGLNYKDHSVDISFKAVGTGYFNPERGFEVSAGLTWPFRLERDWDNDDVIDKNDSCVDTPEDHDGFEDEDGCPDPDNDNDGISDIQDKCPDNAEDLDGFEDEDGCPDYDNDGDGIPDSSDECPMEPEDIDGYQDEDGCPDYDNDGDGIPDSSDECPMEPEDIDGYQDEDGCPDYDNDGDGIPDTIDSCPDSAENFNEYEDADGCPDKKPEKIETETIKTEKQQQKPPAISPKQIASFVIKFDLGRNELKPAALSLLDSLADVLKHPDYKNLRIRISGYSDTKGDSRYNYLLSIARAKNVNDYLIGKGIKQSSLVFIGRGEEHEFTDNKTGRLIKGGRHVFFDIIKTEKKFQDMKRVMEKHVRMLGEDWQGK